MARVYWRGYLKLSLVTCRVSMSPATSDSEKVKFHTLNRKSGNRVMSQYIDSVTGKPVNDGDEAKGYERGEDEFVILSDKELDRVALDTVRTIDIEKFVPADSIEWIYLEKPHYLLPDEPVGQEAFAVIRDAMKSDKVVGISRLVIGRRERAVVLEPYGEGIIVWTLRFGDEVRPEDDYFDDIDAKPDSGLAPLVKRLIKQRMEDWSPEMVSDPIQKSLLKLIAQKKKKLLQPKTKAKGKAGSRSQSSVSNVIDIMDALRKSLNDELKGESRRRSSKI